MISASNTDELAKQLEEYSKEVQRKLEFMVEQFAVDVLRSASSNSRLGDAEEFFNFYQERYRREGWLPIEGMSKGGWVVGLDGNVAFVERHGGNTTNEAVSQAQSDVKGYRLGQPFVIGNAVPYVPFYAEEIEPSTLLAIQAAMESDLKRYYDAG